jgi:nicotinic acid phosphoribosyltransferase
MKVYEQVAAMKGYENANIIALALWEEVYPDGLMFALTDTFSTEAFLKVHIGLFASIVSLTYYPVL